MDKQFLQMKNEWDAEMAASPGIPLWPKGKTPAYRAEYGQPEPSIVPFLADKGAKPRGAVIVCPGGGYEFKAPHEGRPIARMLNAAGIAAFVLDYRVKPYKIDCPLMDVQRAIRTIRHRSGEWSIIPDKIAVLGFSAGGHLSIMASTKFDGGNPASEDPVERESCRPDAQIPCYPGIPSRGLQMRSDMPPAFLWGTWDDFLYGQWPPYLKALKRMKVEYEFHLFPRGGHGMGLAEKNPLASQWPGLCVAWLKELEF